MQVVRDIPSLEAHRGGTFVPTMGALHEGHLALIRRACEFGRPVLVSIFVNQTQFGPGEDFSRYPRDVEGDLAKAREAGAAVAFVPEAETIYPRDQEIPVPPLPDVATKPGLEDAHRPGHFRGVCQVVARLFDLVRPAFAIFGEKDFQQLRVIEEMVKSETDAGARWGELEIVRHPTLREADGLAMSSRNVFLSPEARGSALGLSKALAAAVELASPGRDVRRIEEAMRAVLVRHHLSIDYAAVRDARTLMPLKSIEEGVPARALIAARVQDVRLIDNAAVGIEGKS